MKRIFALLTAVALLCPIFIACGQAPDDGRLSIVTTTFPPYDFARAVVGDAASVTMLIDPGVETHSYDPSPRDIEKIRRADIFIYGGGESDAWLDGVLDSIDTDTVTVIAMTDLVPLVCADGHTDHENHDTNAHAHEYDEHVWTSPANAAEIVRAICDAARLADAENKSLYAANAAAYIAELDMLAYDFAEVIENGARNTVIFADRYPFLYFSEAFGLKYHAAFAGCAHETEAGAQTIARMIDLVKAENVPAVFYIEFSNRRLADAVAEATGCKTLLFHSCHNVTRTELDSGATYVSLMRQNLENLREALS